MRPHNVLAALIAVAVGIGWTIWVMMEPAPGTGTGVSGPAAPGVAAEELTVPSGQKVSFIDRSVEDGRVRFRFLAPDLGSGNLADEASADMEALCNSYALSHLPEGAAPPRQIVVSLSSQAVPLGETRPEVTQVFDAFHVADGKCVWEMF